MNPVKALVQKTLGRFGYRVSRISSAPPRVPPVPDWTQQPTMTGALRRAQFRGVAVNTVIDVGASDGRWSEKCLQVFPDANYLLMEALAAHESKLREFAQIHQNVTFVLAAAGDQEGQVHFKNAGDPFSGAASHRPFESNDSVVALTTIDSQVSRRNLPAPYLIKLDTHGFEAAIFAGAAKTLEQTAIVIVEAYNFELQRAEQTFRFHELCAFMETLGFRCSDLVDPAYREKDYMFWQMDLFFEPESRPEFNYNAFC